MARRRRLALALVALLAATVLAGCAGRYGGGVEPPATTVDIHDDRFEPARVSVQVNESIQFDNVGDDTHTVTFYDGPGNISGAGSGDLEPGDHYTFAPQHPGTYRYRCIYHSEPSGEGYTGMTGKIVVG